MTIEESEATRCLYGVRDDTGHGDDILWLMGWADWEIERQLLEEDE